MIKNTRRQSWNDYFMSIAYTVSQRSTCTRRKVGAVIIHAPTKNIVSTGYNGSLPNAAHCEDIGCHMYQGHCIRTIHAETNAINSAAKLGGIFSESVIYCTTRPCWDCFKNIIQAGIKTIYYKEDYESKTDELFHSYLSENEEITVKKI